MLQIRGVKMRIKKLLKKLRRNRMDLEKLKLSEHSIWRYGQRVKHEELISIQSFMAFNKLCPEVIEIWETEISTLLQDSQFIIQGVFIQ